MSWRRGGTSFGDTNAVASDSMRQVQLERQLPDYLSWATLAEPTVRQDGDALIAQYQYEGEPSYDVRWEAERCRLSRVGRAESFGRSLQEAFLRYMTFADLSEDAQFARFVRRTTGSHNVRFTFPEPPLHKGGAGRWVVYPGGFAYMLRQPIVHENSEAWSALSRSLTRGDHHPLELYREVSGIILRLLEDKTVAQERVVLAELTTLLKNLPACVDLLARERVIASEKPYRLEVLPAF